jgi:hypothetical protein
LSGTSKVYQFEVTMVKEAQNLINLNQKDKEKENGFKIQRIT